ncbi:MAG: DUF72 domain-containing protein [Armatimonadota bacterium]|nr:DUF72 domain-containing protein [Armatimonadota bacterium]
MPRAFVGTSGFSYPEWRGSFYPAGLPVGEMLAHYARTFSTVEINNTFYRYPTAATLARWAEAVPPEFRFAVKAHRRITHLKRLADVDGDLACLSERLRALGDRRGPVLFQLPPSLRYDRGLLTAFLGALRPGAPAVLEVRHPSWQDPAVYRLLDAAGVSLCVAETDEQPAHREVVGPVSYLRLHRSRYAGDDLRRWADWIRQRLAEGRDVYAYFTHEEGAPAPQYARTLARLIGASPAP